MKGFTLVEIMISAAVSFFLLAAVIAVFLVGDRIWQIDMGLVDLQQQGRGALLAMSRELRQASSSGLAISNSGTRVEFSIPDSSENIAYQLVNNSIIRQHPANITRVIATGVTSLFFCCRLGAACDDDCANSDLLEVRLGLGKTVRDSDLAFSLIQEMRLRNE